MFYWVSLGFTGFCWVSFCVSWFVHQFDHVSPGIVGFHQLLPPENGFKHSFVCPLAVRPIGQQRGRKRSSQGKTKRQQVACGKQWHTRPPPPPQPGALLSLGNKTRRYNGQWPTHTHTKRDKTGHGSRIIAGNRRFADGWHTSVISLSPSPAVSHRSSSSSSSSSASSSSSFHSASNARFSSVPLPPPHTEFYLV